MKPAEFNYHRPATVPEAVELLGFGEEPKLLAGGQSLVPLLNMRLAQPTDLIDLGGVAGLADLYRDSEAIRIGAMVRQAQAEHSAGVRGGAPLLVAALRHIAHPQIRARGTVGGSIAHADPAAELPAALLALDGELIVEGREGRRTIRSEDFFRGFLTTALEPDEVLIQARIPTGDADAGWGCVEIARRKGDYALAGAVTLLRTRDGAVTTCRIVTFSLADIPLRATSAEQMVLGQTVRSETWREAGAVTAAELDPGDDLQSTGRYRKHLAAVVVARALEQAAGRCE